MKVKLLAVVLSFAILIVSLPTIAFAAEYEKMFTALYNEKVEYINSFSEEDYSLDCVIAVLKSSVTNVTISPSSLGLSDNYTVEEIYSPSEADMATGREVKSIYRIDLPNATKACAAEALAKLENNLYVESCEVNSALYLDSVTPNDAMYNSQYAHALCSADKDWKYSTGSSSVAVAVLDTGVKLNHPDLVQNIWSKPGEIPNDGIDNDGNGYVDDYHGWDFYNDDNDPTDDNGHGTHVAGIIGAVGNNSIGVAGVCWNVKIVPVKVVNENGGSASNSALLDNVIQAIGYVSSLNVPIINMSLGWYFDSPGLETAINNYFGLFVTSAGNNSLNTDTVTRPSSLPCNNIIAVANTTSTDELSSSSNYGALTVDLAAPGTGIYSTSYAGSYVSMNGTSMAAPYVAGAAALIKSLNPHASTSDIKNAILQNVDEIPALNGKVLTGGRINVLEALTYFVIFGDVDLNGVINVSDVVVLKNHIMSPGLTGNALLAADVDRNGVVNVGDIMALQRLIS